MAFKYSGSLNDGPRILKKEIIANSSVISVGEAVKFDADGFIVTAGAGGAFMGVVAAITRSLEADIAPATNGAGAAYADTYTAAADNETVDQVCVLVDISRDSIYATTLDDTAGTTTGSNLRGGYNIDMLASSLTLDESTTVTTAAQFALLGQDASVTNGVFVKIQESVYVL